MKITYDKEYKQRVWQLVNSKLNDKRCPFCEVPISGKNFAGAVWINGEFRAFDKKLPCLIALTEHLK